MSDFYNRAYKECEVFFGKRTKAFLDRQIETHLSKTPETIDYQDKDALAKWINISTSLIWGKEKAEELTNRILSL